MIPAFDTIPIIQNRTGIRLGFIVVSGVSTQHSSTHTDNGVLYAAITHNVNGSYTLRLYSDFAQSPESEVLASGEISLGAIFDLASVNDSDLTGRARLDGNGTIVNPAIVIVTFATDVDVFRDASRAAAMPGYDVEYGLASFHAAAMRQILTSDLPAALPGIYRSRKISSFVPLSVGAELPDLTEIETPEALRDAQAMLVKAKSATEADHTEEFAEMARLAMENYRQEMADVKDANAPAEVEQQEQTGGIQFGVFTRG